MQLREARLCLDCDEVHTDITCPVCTSESFVYLTRWVNGPSERAASPARPEPRPRPAPTAEAATYRRLIVADSVGSKAGRLLRRGAVGLTVISLARWAWRRHKARVAELMPTGSDDEA